jgi:phosphoglucomutase
MIMVSLADGRRVAIRPSGTEPKIKYYMFGVQRPAQASPSSPTEVAEAKKAVAASLESLWKWLGDDARARL